jgi:dihydrodipicolinate synthase/N-acetylneuraminate lyase
MSTEAAVRSPSSARERLGRGGVVPAHPLALNSHRRLDERRQRALSRYYIESGAAGLAVAVHTTQFAIHDPSSGLLVPVLEASAEVAREYPDRTPLLIAGVCGDVAQAVSEAELAHSLGYDFVLLTLAGMSEVTEQGLLERATAVSEVLPVIGFYMQPAVGGIRLSREYWRALADLPGVAGVKIAPFDRYESLEVIHGIAASSRWDQIAVYTGNDDHILPDLLGASSPGEPGAKPDIVGGLLGQWAVWTRSAVAMHTEAQVAQAGDNVALRRLLALNPKLTDANGVLFDARNGFAGCIAGLHEILRRQGLLEGIWCLDPDETLSPGQLPEIERILTTYPELGRADDEFVERNLARWLG